MTGTKNMKRFSVLVFTFGFALMVLFEPYYVLGGMLIILSVWLDLFTQEQIDAYFEREVHKHHDVAHSPPPVSTVTPSVAAVI